MISPSALALLSAYGSSVNGTSLIGMSLKGTEEFDPNTVTPGVIGFIITFGIAAITVLLLIDMNRRIRRTRYRGEIREQLDAEETEAAATAESEEPPGRESDGRGSAGDPPKT